MACDYLPNNDDIVRARKISTSMEEITFTKKMKKSVSTGTGKLRQIWTLF